MASRCPFCGEISRPLHIRRGSNVLPLGNDAAPAGSANRVGSIAWDGGLQKTSRRPTLTKQGNASKTIVPVRRVAARPTPSEFPPL